MDNKEQQKPQQYESERPETERTQKGSFWGIVIGGVIGILGFWISDKELFILSPFVFGLVGFIIGFVFDRKVEEERKKQVFRNKN